MPVKKLELEVVYVVMLCYISVYKQFWCIATSVLCLAYAVQCWSNLFMFYNLLLFLFAFSVSSQLCIGIVKLHRVLTVCVLNMSSAYFR